MGTQRGAQPRVSKAREAFHTYSIEWTPEEIRGYVDTTHYYTFENERLSNEQANFRQWPFDRPFHLILNVAVGGMWGGAQGIDHAILAAENGRRLRARLRGRRWDGGRVAVLGAGEGG